MTTPGVLDAVALKTDAVADVSAVPGWFAASATLVLGMRTRVGAVAVKDVSGRVVYVMYPTGNRTSLGTGLPRAAATSFAVPAAVSLPTGTGETI